MKIFISVLLLIHGLIVAGQSVGSFASTPSFGTANPAWLNWWPINLGRSWVLSWLGLERAAIISFGGVMWLIAGVCLVGAGLGAFGFLVPVAWWRSLAIGGAGISLFMLLVYFHPLTIIGQALSLAVLIALVWLDWPSASMIR